MTATPWRWTERPADDTVLVVLFVLPDGLPGVHCGLLLGMVGLVDVAARTQPTPDACRENR